MTQVVTNTNGGNRLVVLLLEIFDSGALAGRDRHLLRDRFYSKVRGHRRLGSRWRWVRIADVSCCWY